MKSLRLPVVLWVALSIVSEILAQKPTFVATGVVNAASFEPAISPGVLAHLFGANLASSQRTAAGLPTPMKLEGTEVLVNGSPVPLFMVSPSQISVQFPYDLEVGDAEVIVRANDVASDPVVVELRTHSPAFLTLDQTGTGFGAFIDANFSIFTPESPLLAGDVAIGFAVGLGPTDPPSIAGEVSIAPLVSPAVVWIACSEAEVVAAGQSNPGSYHLNFISDPGLPGGNLPVTVSIGGHTSPPVLLPVAGDSNKPFVCAAVNAASFAPNAAIAAGSILSLFGLNFGSDANLNAFPETVIDGLSVTFDGVPAPVFAVIPEAGQINVLAPNDLTEDGVVEVRVNTPAGLSAELIVERTAADPGIFPVPDPRDPHKVYAAAVKANTAWLPIPSEMAAAMGLPTACAASDVNMASFCGEPVERGDSLQVFVTGLGRATPDGTAQGSLLPTGQVAPADGRTIYHTVGAPTVLIGEVAAQVQFSGLAPGFAGLYQVNVMVPLDAPSGDEVVLRITMPNGASANALVAVRD